MMKRKRKFLPIRLISIIINLIKVQMDIFIVVLAEEDMSQVIYVKDLVNVLTILACGNERFSKEENITVNVGMSEAYTNLEVAKAVNRVFGNPEPIDYDDSYPEKGRPFHMDISRLTDHLGYTPLDMESALRKIK